MGEDRNRECALLTLKRTNHGKVINKDK